MDTEIWKDIPGYEGKYQVSNLGNVKIVSFSNGKVKDKSCDKIMKQSNVLGYRQVQLRKNGLYKHMLVHRLVAIAFIQNVYKKQEVNHKNGIKHDNRVENLEWTSRHENQRHRFEILGHTISKKMVENSMKKTEKCVIQLSTDMKKIKEWKSISEASRVTGIGVSSISQCCKFNSKYSHAGGFIWRYI